MYTDLTAATKTQWVKYVLVSALCIVCLAGMVWLGGCASAGNEGTPTEQEQQSSGQESSGQENAGAAMEDSVTGVITSLGEKELMIETTAESEGNLQGKVRVDISNIDTALLEKLQVGDTIKVEFPGVAGLSEPPLISAKSIELL